MTVLVITETGDLAADLIVLELQRRRIKFERLNVDQFPDRLRISYDPFESSVNLAGEKTDLCFNEVRSAWFRYLRRTAHSDAYVEREVRSFLAGLWNLVNWRWVNSPSAIDQAVSKPWQLHTAVQLGFEVPRTLITNDLSQITSTFDPGPIIVKTIAGAAVSRLGSRQLLYSQLIDVADLDTESVKAAPCIYQASAKPGTDMRVTVVGDRLFATEIAAPIEFVDWRSASPESVVYTACVIDDQTAQQCQSLCNVAGLVYGAIDLVRQPDGRLVFLEINPSGQWGWIEEATGQAITEAIVDVLTDP